MVAVQVEEIVYLLVIHFEMEQQVVLVVELVFINAVPQQLVVQVILLQLVHLKEILVVLLHHLVLEVLEEVVL